MFFSANLDYPKKLESAGLIVPGSYYQYARGKIVVWVAKDSKIDLSGGLKALLDPNVKKIAVANPLQAPYGQAAVSAMQKEGIYDKLTEVFGDLHEGDLIALRGTDELRPGTPVSAEQSSRK